MMDITTFVRGMAWHDIAKPIHLRNDRHSRLGYVLLNALGYPNEALVALAHVSFKGGPILAWQLEEVLGQDGAESLPGILALEHALDRLAAASYWLMEQLENPEIHTLQNPFSRLPRATSEFALREDPDGVWKGHFRSEQHGFGEVFSSALQHLLQEDAIRTAVQEAIARTKEFKPGWEDLDLLSSSLPDAPGILRWLQGVMERFPERTYPPANDTDLESHTRFSAVLAFVMYRNLEHRTAFLDERIMLRSERAWMETAGVSLVAFIERKVAGSDDLPFSAAMSCACNQLDGVLVRVALAGHRDLVETAVRLDDLGGARRLTELVRQAFKAALADKLGVPELTDFLWLSESVFELVYYLPACLSDELDGLLADAFEAACVRVVDNELIGLLEREFDTDDPLDFAQRRDALLAQLLVLQPSVSKVSCELTTDGLNFEVYALQFGKLLLDAFKATEKRMSLMPGAIASYGAYLEHAGHLQISAVCAACGVNPVDEEFYQRLLSPDAQNAVFRKATHQFRGNPEPLCICCVARRELSHGMRRSRPLEAMLRLDAETSRLVVEPTGYERMIPPGLVGGQEIPAVVGAHAASLVDAGAAYVRRNRYDPARLDVFPTIAYAADADSNVALLTLTTTPRLFEDFRYDGLIAALPSKDDRAGTGADNANANEESIEQKKRSAMQTVLEKTVRDYCEKYSGLPDHENVQVAEAHIARVLARIRLVSAFFESLPEMLEDAGIRTLALDSAYPLLRVLVPADRLGDALGVLHLAIGERLFSFLTVGDGSEKQLVMPPDWLLPHVTQPVLKGSVVVFKQKQALYLVLQAEQDLLETDPPDDGWLGVHLRLADMRGTLSAQAYPIDTAVTFDNLPGLLELAHVVDRRTILSAAATRARPELDRNTGRQLSMAELFVRSDWVTGLKERIGPLSEDKTFAVVHFLKTVTKQ